MPKFTPAVQNSTAVEVTYTLPICFSLDGNCYSKIVRSSPFQSEWYKSPARRSISINNTKQKKQLKQKVDTVRNINDLQAGEIMQYALNTSKLGWINCDRFYNNKAPKVNLAINTDSNENVMIRLVFKSINSVMSGSKLNDKYTFANIPINEKVTVFSLKQENGSYYIATQELITGGNTPTALSYNKIDKDKLNEEIKKLSL